VDQVLKIALAPPTAPAEAPEAPEAGLEPVQDGLTH
jgi:hypothetical protein